MAPNSSPSEELAHAIRAANPFLGRVAVPKPGLIAAPVRPPDLYPDDLPVRGYYLPVPPPAPRKVDPAAEPVLLGEWLGRQWSVHVTVPSDPKNPVFPTLGVSSYVRLLPTDGVPFPVLPWVVATGQPILAHGALPWSAGSINMSGMLARLAVGRASQFLSRPLVTTTRPPVRGPVLLEAWEAPGRSFLESAGFLESYARWERRAGPGSGPSGSVLPLFQATGDRFDFHTGVDLATSPSEHATTVREVMEQVVALERAVTGRDALSDPIPTITFFDPPGSVRDIRPAYRCPNCGQLEILRVAPDRATQMKHMRTLRCGVDVFPPYRDKVAEIARAAESVVRR
jgi:hypothetical protein